MTGADEADARERAHDVHDVLVPVPPPRDGAARLLDGEPADVLRRLVDGDPLQLEARCARRLRERALLVDLARLCSATATEIARRSRRPVPADLDEHVTACLDVALAALLREDRAEERTGRPSEHGDPRYEFLTRTFAVEWAGARLGAVAFNGLPAPTRRAFFALAMEGLDVEAARARDAETGAPPDDLAERVSCALRTLLDPDAATASLEPPEATP